MGTKRKRRRSYEINLSVKVPGEPGVDGTDLQMRGPVSPEIGRLLWLMCAAMGNLLGREARVGDEVATLRLALERFVEPGNRCELGRLPGDAAMLAASTKGLEQAQRLLALQSSMIDAISTTYSTDRTPALTSVTAHVISSEGTARIEMDGQETEILADWMLARGHPSALRLAQHVRKMGS